MNFLHFFKNSGGGQPSFKSHYWPLFRIGPHGENFFAFETQSMMWKQNLHTIRKLVQKNFKYLPEVPQPVFQVVLVRRSIAVKYISSSCQPSIQSQSRTSETVFYLLYPSRTVPSARKIQITSSALKIIAGPLSTN